MDNEDLAQLLDRRSITEALHRCGGALDRMDHEHGRSSFRADAVTGHGALFQGAGHALIGHLYRGLVGMRSHCHHVDSWERRGGGPGEGG
jgi:hypothetical protein